ncbi:MAG TPA: SDR family oxidoreductase [Longimicrobiales bacterium]|nr:SDR family oxidoreductase [Longimicrobiales bacterium]
MNHLEEIKKELQRAPRTWLVTGVAGFIGSNLLETLLDLGQKVVGLDNFSSGYRRNLNEVVREGRRARRHFQLIEGDIGHVGTCLEACREVDYVLHQAAIGSVPRSVEDPIETNRVNVDGTVNVLLAARDRGVRRVVLASSSAVYGDCTELPAREERIGAPLSPYAVTKYTDEKYADVFSRTYGLSTVALRYFNVFGPRQDPLGSYAAVIPHWIQALLAGETCKVHGDGETTRDFVAVADVVQANLLAAMTSLEPGAARVYNVGAGRRTSLNELHAMLAEGLQRLQPEQTIAGRVHDDFRAGDVRHSQADITRIAHELHYAPTPDLALELEATLRWYLKRSVAGRAMARSA